MNVKKSKRGKNFAKVVRHVQRQVQRRVQAAPILMSPSVSDRKVPLDSLEHALKTEENRASFFIWVENHKLREAPAHLLKVYGIKRDFSKIALWARARRTDLIVQKRFAWLRESDVNAGAVAASVGDVMAISKANVTLLQAALLDAQLTKNAKQKMAAAKLLNVALLALAKNVSAEAQMLSANTAHDKFQTNVAKLALDHAAELQEINKGQGSDRDKTERAKIRLFGERPRDLAK